MSQYLRIMSLKMRWPWIWATFGIQTYSVVGYDPVLASSTLLKPVLPPNDCTALSALILYSLAVTIPDNLVHKMGCAQPSPPYIHFTKHNRRK